MSQEVDEVARPEGALDPDAGPVPLLAHQLRELRRTAGGPSYRSMAAVSGVSATTLSRAAAGEQLPTWNAVRGYVLACGGDPAEWETRWKETEAALAGAVREEERDASPPYRGLARFEPGDRGLFFGRERMLAELERLVGEHRLAVLFGASGSGKSSLLRAGLIPRLRERVAGGTGPAVLRILTPGPSPAAAYGHLLAPAADGAPESWVVVDQFEELFTLCRDRAERARFIDLLLAARAPDSGLRVLVSVRADFYARCLEHRGLADALRGAALALGPMTAEELREAVVRPAAATGLLVERELTARIVDEVQGEPGGLPMLSHALLETWRRRRSRMLTLAAYEAAGGVRGAIAASAEEVYGQLDPRARTTARRLLLRLVEPGRGAGTPDTRRPLPRAELDEWADPLVPRVVELLSRARLLTADEDGVQLAHEALITCWPRLADWLEEDRERLRDHRRLTEAALAWREAGRDTGALWRGTRLDRAQDLLGPELTGNEKEFIERAGEARDAEHRTAARAARRSRLLLTSLSAVLAVALAAGLLAWTQHSANGRQRTEAAARRIAAVSDSLRTTDPRTALLLSAAAWRLSPLPESRRAVLAALAQPGLDAFTVPTPDGPSPVLADSGRTLLTVDGTTWHTWNVTTHAGIASGTLPAGAQLIAAAPDARVLALSTPDGIRLWDTARRRWTGAPEPFPRRSTDIAFGGSGRSYLLSDQDSGRLQLRSVADDRLLYETRAPGVAAVAPDPEDRQIAVCTPDRGLEVWDRTAHRGLPGAWQGARDLCAADDVRLVFGRGSDVAEHRLALVSAVGVHVWDTRTGRQLAAPDDSQVDSAAFSPDGAFLATADTTEIRVWRLAAPGAPVFRHTLDDQQAYGALSWDPARPTLRHLSDNTVRSFDVTTPTTSSWRAHALAAALLAPDGDTLATVEHTGAAYHFTLRSTGHTERAHPLPSLPSLPDTGPPLMTFSPDGRTFAYGTARRIVVRDLTGARAPATLALTPAAPADDVLSLALAPGGRTLYAARATDAGGAVDEVWDTARARRTGVVKGLASRHLALGPGGRILVGDDRAVRLPSPRPLPPTLAQEDGIRATAFTTGGSGDSGDSGGSDGFWLAAGGLTGRVTLWDGDPRDRAAVLDDAFLHTSADAPEAVTALALSPDGRTLAVGGDAGTLQLWDVQTRQPLGGPLPTPGEPLTSLAFGADADTLYASGTHVPLHRYTVDPAQAVRQVCARAGADLTRAQWRTYLPDATYRRVCRPAD
ncbi:hypothetical protein [Streptomyces sp. NPDC048277]|uniref:nSTAND1 domain-containing NTPase n=1 Tax=Streptomyces sp. NPDC048277 TaxID=3155027 RepID=UPI0033CA02AB